MRKYVVDFEVCPRPALFFFFNITNSFSIRPCYHKIVLNVFQHLFYSTGSRTNKTYIFSLQEFLLTVSVRGIVNCQRRWSLADLSSRALSFSPQYIPQLPNSVGNYLIANQFDPVALDLIKPCCSLAWQLWYWCNYILRCYPYIRISRH